MQPVQPATLWRSALWLTAVGGVLPLLITWRFGALGIPRNDDWSFLIASFRFADGGGIDGNGWAMMNLVGQLVIALPVNVVFGNRIAPLQALVAGFGVVGLVAVYDLSRHWLTHRRALFGATLLAAGPLWAALAGSFMTDLPMFALCMICLAAGARALDADRRSTGWLAVALVAGFAGFAIRQYALVAVVAVMLGGVWHGARLGRRRLVVVVALCAATVGAAAVFYLWRLGLPGFDDPPLQVPTRPLIAAGIDRGLRAAILVGLLAFPALVVVGVPRTIVAAGRRSLGFAVVPAGGLMVAFGFWAERKYRTDLSSMISPGNYVRSGGILGTDVIAGVRPDLLPRSLMTVLVLLGMVSAVVAFGAATSTIPAFVRSIVRGGRGGSPARTVTILALLGFGVASAAPVFLGMPLFDRYLLPVIATTVVLLLGAPVDGWAPSRGDRWAAGVAVAGLTAVGLVFSCNAASFDGARWRAAERAAQFTGDVGRIDGGFEWINYHAGRAVFFTPEREAPRYCVRLVSSPDRVPGWNDVAEPVWGPFGTQAWIVAEQRVPC